MEMSNEISTQTSKKACNQHIIHKQTNQPKQKTKKNSQKR